MHRVRNHCASHQTLGQLPFRSIIPTCFDYSDSYLIWRQSADKSDEWKIEKLAAPCCIHFKCCILRLVFQRGLVVWTSLANIEQHRVRVTNSYFCWRSMFLDYTANATLITGMIELVWCLKERVAFADSKQICIELPPSSKYTVTDMYMWKSLDDFL